QRHIIQGNLAVLVNLGELEGLHHQVAGVLGHEAPSSTLSTSGGIIRRRGLSSYSNPGRSARGARGGASALAVGISAIAGYLPPSRVENRMHRGKGSRNMHTAIPLCDVQGQFRELKDQIQEAIDRVLASGQVILGPEVAALEAEVARYCGAGFGVGCSSGSD